MTRSKRGYYDVIVRADAYKTVTVLADSPGDAKRRADRGEGEGQDMDFDNVRVARQAARLVEPVSPSTERKP